MVGVWGQWGPLATDRIGCPRLSPLAGEGDAGDQELDRCGDQRVFVVVVFVVAVFVVIVFVVVVFALVAEEVDAGDQELDRCGDQRVNTICNV